MKAAKWLEHMRSLHRDEGGQVLPMVCVMMLGLVGVGALGLDVGHAQYTYRMLQASTDADALAAAQAMAKPTSTVATINGGTTAKPVGSTGVVASYSSAPGGWNVRSSLTNVSVTSSLKCLATLQAEGLPCVGTIPFNAVQVSQSMTLPTFFGGLVGKSSLPISVTSTAAARGGAPRPTNVAVVIDTTLSMQFYDDNCSQTQMQCALNGFQVLLKSLQPCGLYQSSCNPQNNQATNSFDRVAVFTFPNVTTSSAYIDSDCPATMQANSKYNSTNDPIYGVISMWPVSPTYPNSSVSGYPGIANGAPYSFPSATATSYSPAAGSATYQLTSFLSDYRLADSSTSLNAASPLVMAAGAVTGCNGMEPSNWDGDIGTYYAGAIYAAEAALVSEQSQYPGSENVLIILGDGDSNSPQTNGSSWTNFASTATSNGLYPSWVNECKQAVTAAQAATSAGTLVYTVAYGSSAITGCSTDTSSSPYLNNPCDAMGAMASAPQMFYSDWKQTGSDGTCTSSQPAVSLNSIFAAIASDLSTARLIPNNTT